VLISSHRKLLWSKAMVVSVAENRNEIPAGKIERGERKRTASEVSKALVLHGGHRPILVVYDRGRVFALDNRCPHMGFPLERGSVEDGILTCHWHHARFDLESGCTSTSKTWCARR
jgi:nitrite reductase/ring-hydroxylating ferredoxin subunit